MLRICRMMLMAASLVVPLAAWAAGNGGGIAVQTIKVSSVSPLLTLKFWDYEAEDGDWVRIVVDGEVYQEFELKNAPKTITIPILFSDQDEVFVNVIGTRSGNGPVTYAVQATGLGSTTEVYKNYTDVGSGNSYRIIKTKDDIFSTGVNFIAGLFGMESESYRPEDDDVGIIVAKKYFSELSDACVQVAILRSDSGTIEKAKLWGERVGNVFNTYDVAKFTGEFLTDGIVLGDWDQAARDTENFVLDWTVRPWFALGVWSGERVFNLLH